MSGTVEDLSKDVESDYYGRDENGDMWLNTPGRGTRGPMDADRVEVVADG